MEAEQANELRARLARKAQREKEEIVSAGRPSRFKWADFVDFGDETDPQGQEESARATGAAGENPEETVKDGEKAGAMALGGGEAGAAVAGEGAASGPVAAVEEEGAGTVREGDEEGEKSGNGAGDGMIDFHCDGISGG